MGSQRVGHDLVIKQQQPGDSGGQGSLACCSPWGCRVRADLATEQQQKLAADTKRPSLFS